VFLTYRANADVDGITRAAQHEALYDFVAPDGVTAYGGG